MQPLVLAHFVDGDDIGMLQIGRRLGLAVEAGDFARAGQAPARIIFNATSRRQVRLPGLPDHAHAALGDFFQKLVVAEVADSVNRRPAGQGVVRGQGCGNAGGSRAFHGRTGKKTSRRLVGPPRRLYALAHLAASPRQAASRKASRSPGNFSRARWNKVSSFMAVLRWICFGTHHIKRKPGGKSTSISRRFPP